ncbi:MAG: YceI family protein [Alcanivorax sp.]|nr:YceI family protein [Alcanivorax sp.]
MRIALCLLLGLTLASPFALADTTDYTIDPHHTQVLFSWHHFGFSTPTANFNQVTGTIHADNTDPQQSSVAVSIPVKSLDTHVPLLDEHLLTKPEFFHPHKYPTITFKSSAIRNVDRKHNTFDLVGTLTVNGISKQEVLKASLNKRGHHPMWNNAPAVGFSAHATLKRSDFGMDAYVPAVSDTLDVNITVEAIESHAYAAKMKEMQQQAK